MVQPQPLSLSEIQQQALDNETLLLEYALGRERSYLWVISKNSINSFPLAKREEIEAAAKRVYALLTARNQHPKDEVAEQTLARIKQADEALGPEAVALSRMVLAPAAALLGKKRLLIVSEGALQYIPFAALPAPGVRGAEEGEKGRKGERVR